MNEFLKQAEKFLLEGRELKARQLILRYRFRPGQTAEDYFRWGVLCETLGLKLQAADCYELAISREPHEPRYLLARAEVAYELGELLRAEALFRRVLWLTESQSVRRKLAQVLRELGRPGAAAAVAGPSESVSRESPLRYFPPNLGPRELEPLRVLFRGRPLYAELHLTSYGKTALILKEGSLPQEKLSQHLLGRIFLLYFPLTEKKELYSAYLQVAFPEREVDRKRRSQAWLLMKSDSVKREALSVIKRARSWGLEGALERVSPYCYRVWFFFSEPVYFLWARRLLETLKERLPIPGQGLVYSWAIGTRAVGVGWREAGFELPLGVHPVTLERSLFVDLRGEPYPEQLSFLRKVQPLDFETIREFCRKSVSISVPEDEPRELKRLRRACPVLDFVIRRAEAGKHLSREEKLAIMLSVGFLKDGRRLLHRILSGTPDYSYHRTERMLRGIPQNPISCARLETWFRHLVLDRPCGCVFGKVLKERYPSPLLHVDPERVPTPRDRFTPEFSRPAELGQIYLHLRERLQYVENQLRRCLQESSPKLRVGRYILTLDGERIVVRLRSA